MHIYYLNSYTYCIAYSYVIPYVMKNKTFSFFLTWNSVISLSLKYYYSFNITVLNQFTYTHTHTFIYFLSFILVHHAKLN